MKVRIESISSTNQWGDYIEETVVYVDDKQIGEGFYGGEPEDNMRGRSYSWVELLLKKLALALDAEAEIVSIKKIEVDREPEKIK